MYNPTATKTPKIISSQGFLPFRLRSVCFPSQYRINLTELLNVLGVLLDKIVGLTTKTRRLEILTALNDLCGHLLRKAGVILVQHLQRFLVLVFGFAHTEISFLTTRAATAHSLEQKLGITSAKIQNQ